LYVGSCAFGHQWGQHHRLDRYMETFAPSPALMYDTTAAEAALDLISLSLLLSPVITVFEVHHMRQTSSLTHGEQRPSHIEVLNCIPPASRVKVHSQLEKRSLRFSMSRLVSVLEKILSGVLVQ